MCTAVQRIWHCGHTRPHMRGGHDLATDAQGLSTDVHDQVYSMTEDTVAGIVCRQSLWRALVHRGVAFGQGLRCSAQIGI